MDIKALYDEDFLLWTGRQAAALRRLAADRANLGADLDLDHLAEEVEDLGHRNKNAAESALARIFEHLIKLEHSPAPWPRRLWRQSVARQRDAVARLLKDSPSLGPYLPTVLQDAWDRARRSVALGESGREGWPESLPAEPPYALDQLLDHAWWPASRHGLD
jgi:hypothetical protein